MNFIAVLVCVCSVLATSFATYGIQRPRYWDYEWCKGFTTTNHYQTGCPYYYCRIHPCSIRPYCGNRQYCFADYCSRTCNVAYFYNKYYTNPIRCRVRMPMGKLGR